VTSKPIDVALVGGGIMSATLGALLKQLQPTWSIQVFERLSGPAQESSNPWNNAGTGHAALCELNYMAEAPDGSVEASKAVAINEQFQLSRQFWSYLVAGKLIGDPQTFINSTPHMTFVWGQKNVEYMRKRVAVLKNEPLFAGMEYSEDPMVIGEWAPLLIENRLVGEPVAATRIDSGTDVDFGSLTTQLLDYLAREGAGISYNTQVVGLTKQPKDGLWRIKTRDRVGNTPRTHFARFVFVGAGGGALALLQNSGIPEIQGYGGFPISGEFLRTDNPEIVAQHQAKVYGKAAVGAPPMSVPHLDTRVVDGKASLLFGPYAGFSPNFLKKGSMLDLPLSIRFHNIITMLGVAISNLDLLKYLIGEVIAGPHKKLAALREFMPTAEAKDWHLIKAGQRVQVMKRDRVKGGVLQFGTEVVSSADGSIAGLLGASPGASTAVAIMLELLSKCFPEQLPSWKKKISAMIPSYGTRLSDDPAKAKASLAKTAAVLNLKA
jgi:malate dehydrogenase (quinone)